jgi:hypothetical protein
MMLRSCPRESEVAALVERGQWPDACTDELRAHVEVCRACGDLVLLTQAFRAARTASINVATPVAAGVLWWRAQLRRRKAAMKQIGKPVLGAQIFALAATITIAAIFAVSQARFGLRWLAWFRQIGESPALHFEDLWSAALAMPQWALVLSIAGLAAVAVLGGFVLFSDRQRQ